jgi:hypothetical protein
MTLNTTSAQEIAAKLTEAQRSALMPNSTESRVGLLKLGLAKWKRRPGQRWPSLMPTSLGYEVRHLLEQERQQARANKGGQDD